MLEAMSDDFEYLICDCQRLNKPVSSYRRLEPRTSYRRLEPRSSYRRLEPRSSYIRPKLLPKTQTIMLKTQSKHFVFIEY